jgi:hypothetical protein
VPRESLRIWERRDEADDETRKDRHSRGERETLAGIGLDRALFREDSERQSRAAGSPGALTTAASLRET